MAYQREHRRARISSAATPSKPRRRVPPRTRTGLRRSVAASRGAHGAPSHRGSAARACHSCGDAPAACRAENQLALIGGYKAPTAATRAGIIAVASRWLCRFSFLAIFIRLSISVSVRRLRPPRRRSFCRRFGLGFSTVPFIDHCREQCAHKRAPIDVPLLSAELV